MELKIAYCVAVNETLVKLDIHAIKATVAKPWTKLSKVITIANSVGKLSWPNKGR